MPSFLADECVARAIVEGLIQRGLDVVDAKEVCRGDSDERVLALAETAGRIVITHDWGFGAGRRRADRRMPALSASTKNTGSRSPARTPTPAPERRCIR
jgi:hypothetical protein